MIQSLRRGMQTLFILSKRKSAGVTEIAEELDVNKSTAFRILETMISFNVVTQNKETLKYKLGPGILRLSDQLIKNLDIISAAKPFMARLVEDTGESSHLCMLSNDSAVVIEQIMTDSLLSVNAKVGNSEPVYCSSVGKCLLAFCEEDKKESILAGIDFKPYTKNTITSPEKLRKELDEIVAKGYATDEGEMNEDIMCIAAPIHSHSGIVLHSLGISGPLSRIKNKKSDAIICQLIKAARNISEQLGYEPGSDEPLKE